MSKLSIPELIMSINSDLVYLADIDTYEVLYINNALSVALGNPSDYYLKSTPCYKLFQGLDEPCPFCTNQVINENSTHTWTHHNKLFDKWYTLNDKKIIHEGRNLRLEVARDVNEIMKSKAVLSDLIEEERILVDCVSLLHSQTSPEQAIKKLLEAIATFHEAERAYIFEIDEVNKTVSNTHEWCKENISAQIKNSQAIDIGYFSLFLDALKGNNTLYIRDVDKDISKSKYPIAYKMLKEQNTNSIIITPIKSSNGTITGLLGVNNPKTRTYAESLFTPIAYFISELQEKQNLITQLHKSTYMDLLTDLKNITSFRNDIELLERRLPKTCGIAYIDIHELKKINQTKGGVYGDNVIKKLAFYIRDLFLDCTYRIGSGEFVIVQPNCSKEDFKESLVRLQATVNQANDFKIALGSTWANNFDNGLQNHLKDVEQDMIMKKKEFFSNLGFDRRNG